MQRHARRRRGHGADRLAAVRDHRRPAQRRGDHARVLRAARHRRDDAALGRRAGRDDRLQRQQQGRRRVHEQLGAVLRRDRAGRAVRRARRIARHHAAPLPRPRRHGRPRRRPELPGDPGPAAGHGERADPPHRAGRGDRLEVRAARDRPAQPRDAGRGDARGDAAAADARRAEELPRRGAADQRGEHGGVPRPRLRDAGLHRLLLQRDADPRDRRAQHRLASCVAQGQPRASRTCARSRGASAGASAASPCPAGTASASASRPSSARARAAPTASRCCAGWRRSGRSSPP